MRPSRPGASGEDHPHWRWRDRILDHAEPVAGETVLDVGCGEGLVAFGALERGATAAIFSDISQDLLAYCRTAAADLGMLDRCSFVHAPAEDLSAIETDERDLMAFAEEAGFHPIHLELEAEVRPHDPAAWDDFVSRAGNPRIPSLERAMREALNADERRMLVDYLRPLVERGAGTYRMAVAFLRAIKP